MTDLVLIGAGLRGMVVYGSLAAAAGLRFVSVVEPVASRREAFGDLHGIDPAQRHDSLEAWLAAPRVAAAAVVATPDQAHVAPVLAALEAGYDVLVEKPMAPTAEACVELVEAAERAGRQLHVCHVLRYTPFWRAVHDLVRGGRLGRVVSVTHLENVDVRHFAHSYVRGAYARAAEATPFLLAKACHDLDLLHWILDDPAVRVCSFGSLNHFRPDRVDAEVPARCTDGCPVEETCAVSAIAAYAPTRPPAGPEIAVLTQLFPLSDPPTFDQPSRLEALRTSPYGRCAYRCDNDVVDHQVVAMELASGATATLTVHGHSHREGRTLRLDGTEATLRGAFTEVGAELTLHPHGTDVAVPIPLDVVTGVGHGGGDLGVLQAFAASLAGHGEDDGGLSSSGRASLASHLLGWAAEDARRRGCVVDLPLGPEPSVGPTAR